MKIIIYNKFQRVNININILTIKTGKIIFTFTWGNYNKKLENNIILKNMLIRKIMRKIPGDVIAKIRTFKL